jgi:hypothetical protein
MKLKEFFPSQPHTTVSKMKSSCKSLAVWLVPDPEWGWAWELCPSTPQGCLGCPMYFPPFRGGKYLDIPLWVGDSRCGNLWTMLMNNYTNNKGGTCTNSHCLEGTCKGECEREYHYQALRVVKMKLEEIKGDSKPLRPQKGVL